MTDLVSFRHGNITLYLQDALEGMRVLPDKSFDLALVDPPYGASSYEQLEMMQHLEFV